MALEKQGHKLKTLADWKAHAPPKDPDKQWVDGRSAVEAAKAWLEVPGAIPPELDLLLRGAAGIGALTVERIEPEALLPFDSRSGPRNADIAIVARDETGPIAITVEAKADEPFDKLVADVLHETLERLLENPRSGGLNRVIDLARSLLPARVEGQPHVQDLRYQLLTAAAGTVAFARTIGASRAVLFVHEFVTAKTSRKNLARNAADYVHFVHRLSGGTVRAAGSGMLHGPFRVPGAPLFDEPALLYVGKATRAIGEPSE